jgi:hypothetical protein
LAAAESVPEMITALDDLLRQGQQLDDESLAGLVLARDILIDGAGTIYSPFDPVNEILGDAPPSADPLEHTTHHGVTYVAQIDAETAAMAGSQGGPVSGYFSVCAALDVIVDAFAS